MFDRLCVYLCDATIADNGIGEAGARALAEALTHPNCHVTSISLSGE